MHTIEITHERHASTIWLDRPDVRNAFDETMMAELTAAFEDLGARTDVRVIVLAARGPAFCAGGDLNWMKRMAGYSAAENLADAGHLAHMLRAVYLCPKQVVARVHGDCYAGGMGLVAACDIAVAAEPANFCLSEVKLGLIPATISPYVIAAIGHSAARRYFLTAERFDAHEALRIGMVHAVAPDHGLDAQVAAIVKALAGASPNAVKEAKRLVRDVAGAPLSDALVEDTVQRIAAIRASDDGREGVRAFLEKRKPSWLIE